jgi:predicted transcriptional regulator
MNRNDAILALLEDGKPRTRMEIEDALGVSRGRAIRLMCRLQRGGYVTREASAMADNHHLCYVYRRADQ